MIELEAIGMANKQCRKEKKSEEETHGETVKTTGRWEGRGGEGKEEKESRRE